MIHPQRLLADLQSLLPKLELDILDYSRTRPELEAHLQAEYAKAQAANRTAEHFVAWREAQITQAAAAWVLTGVCVRFLEDNQLLEAPFLSGSAAGAGRRAGHRSGQSALQQAKDRLTVYFNAHPTHAERDYLLAVFEELESLPTLAELLDRAHNPLRQLPLAADGAKALIDFFQWLDPETGAILHDFSDPEWDTRFLGDLYQDQLPDVVFPYGLSGTLPPHLLGRYIQILWCYRTQLWLRQGKGFKTKEQQGGDYYEYSMFYPDRHFAPLKITFAFVATHNHFVLDRGGKVFNRSAPVIKLPAAASEHDHLALMGLLNSSTAMFWMRQVFHGKGQGGVGQENRAEWEEFREFTGTGMKSFPVPDQSVADGEQSERAAEGRARRGRCLSGALSYAAG